MASARIQRKKQVTLQRTEFNVPLDRVLTELLNPGQVDPADKWEFVSMGTGLGLTIIRERATTINYDDNGDPIP